MTAAAPRPGEMDPLRHGFIATRTIDKIVLPLCVAMALVTYLVISPRAADQQLLTPPLVALLLIANLICFGSLIVLFGRRLALRRAERSGAGGRLHVRLVAIFSVLASVPTVLLAVVASLMFQYGAEFWFSGKTRGIVDNSQSLAMASYGELLKYVDNENVAMATDVQRMLFENNWPIESKEFHDTYQQDVFQRSLSNSLLFSVGADGAIKVHDRLLNAPNFADKILPEDVKRINDGSSSVANTDAKRTYSLARVPGTELFLYSTRESGAPEMAKRLALARQTYRDYQALRARTRSLQLQFNAALLAISLLIIAIAVWIALTVADRLIRPVGELVDAARKVEGGDLTARVRETKERDELGTLSRAFNQMAVRLQNQNKTLESRRALIEAVMAGVSAGVLSTASDRSITIANNSAARLLAVDTLVGRALSDVSPELDLLVRDHQREAIVQVGAEGERRTLAVRIARADAGSILTFDDITQQQLDQRRAAWADVARRIAHEIKNPLTPIQLAAERLQRRYGGKVEAGDTTFARLTDTIVRQVGDLRRMVDEFSSFARMPKPMFRDEALGDIARQTLFLHEVAHPGIRFELLGAEPGPYLVCDRRQIGQALTNLVKNAVEAIEVTEASQGVVTVALSEGRGRVAISVTDTGVGLPADRKSIVEPYVTTRARGTGLGLAIVNKIVEEHLGTMTFADRDGGGTAVLLSFDAMALEQLDGGAEPAQSSGEEQLAQLTPMRT